MVRRWFYQKRKTQKPDNDPRGVGGDLESDLSKAIEKSENTFFHANLFVRANRGD